ncbi:MBL fold metallo-hydrolase [Amycolatopsis methanolica]|uniref:MBL fold metallo-hydrolase n=1 Tax=Amycolatopsis methanolica TaxID=1814 RepID=UPI00342DFECD
MDLVVLTHLHYDHAGTVADFPGARYLVQRGELAYWTGSWAKRIRREHWLLDEDALAHVRGDRLSEVDGDAEVLPGLSVHLVGGHTAGTQIVRVATAAGPVVVASDASHFYENLDDAARRRCRTRCPASTARSTASASWAASCCPATTRRYWSGTRPWDGTSSASPEPGTTSRVKPPGP